MSGRLSNKELKVVPYQSLATRSLVKSMHKNVHGRAHGRLWVMELEREETRRVLSSGVLEMKDDIDRTGMKK